MERFRALVSVEGSKRSSIRVTVPKATVRALKLLAPCWVRMRVNGSDPFFAYARRPPSRPSVDVGLTQRLFPLTMAGTMIDCEIESAEPFRACAWTDHVGFDWLPLVATEHYFPIETITGDLVLHNRYEEPFVMRRVTPLLPTYRMLGLYQAEGSKSKEAPDFSMGNSNPLLLAHAVGLLRTWGLDRARLSLEVLREEGEDPAAARAIYEPIGVEIVAERIRAGAGGNAGTLHVRKSQPLLRLVKAALVKVFASPFPSPDTALQYTLAWLAGDGSIIRRGGSDDLTLAGHADEHAVLKRALETAFGWTFEAGSHHRNTDDGTHITLRGHEMLDLLDAGAFSLSMSRTRLFLCFGDRTEALHEARWNGHGLRGSYVRWGILNVRGELTATGKRLKEGRQRYERAIMLARRLWKERPELFGKKGVPYPPEMEGL